ncbi:hypothetical protein CBL13_00721 [Pseudomonas putida]|nr:hypothetical protein CBL13_00721 [Pseudomonas putida]
MVLIRPTNPDPGGQRSRKTPAQGSQKSRQPRTVGNLVRRQVRQQNAQGRHEEQRHANPHEQLHQGHVLEVHLAGETGPHVATGANRQERQPSQHPQVETVRIFAHERRHDHRQQTDRRHRQARPSRGIAHLRLQPLRQDQVDTEEPGIPPDQHNGANAEVAVHKQAQVDHRVPVGQFPDHEYRQEHHRNQAADNDERRLEPVQIVALVQHYLQGPNADNQGQQANVIHRLAAGDHRARAHLLAHHGSCKQADGHVDEEDPWPAVAIGNPAPKNRPGNRRHHRDHRQQRQCHPPFCRGVDSNQQGLGHRVKRPGDHTLQDAKPDQLGHRLGDTAQERSQHEQQRGPDEQFHFTKAPAQPAGQRQGDSVAHRERGDDPGALLVAHPQVAGNGRQGHVGDGGVQHLHERRERQADGGQQQTWRRELGSGVVAHRCAVLPVALFS